MSKRKNYGRYFLIASFVLGFLMVLGASIWVQNKADMLLAVFVLIRYGIGQWTTVIYWQNIQNDWETTGEALGRLQQAVSDIPKALEVNLKAIAEKLSEGQQQALSKLQSEVSEGARQTLEKGSIMIGESIAKNFQGPVGSLNSILVSFTDKSSEQSQLLKTLVEDARKDSRQSVETGASLISASLDKNLRAPLASMENALSAWRREADVQIQATLAFGEEMRKAQAEWNQKAQALADGLNSELQALAQAGARATAQSQQAWAERASELQSTWETQITVMQDGLVTAVSRESEKLGTRLSQGADTLIERMVNLHASQSDAQAAILDKALTGMAEQSRTVTQSSEVFALALEELKTASLKLIGDVESKASEGQKRLIEEISKAQQLALGEAGKTLEVQGQIGLDIASKVSDLAEQMVQGSKDFQELSHLAQVNQVEMQAGVGMLNSGLATILDRLEKQAAAGDGAQNFLSDLARALATFQERASEVLIENSLKTQEILMEVLSQSERKNSAEAVENAV